MTGTARYSVALAFGLIFFAASHAATRQLSIAPSLTNELIRTTDPHHLILYDPAGRQGKLLVWLPGTGGKPDKGPQQIYQTALEQGYRVIGLSYVDEPAVAQVCVGQRNKDEPGCAEKFRQKRAFGDNVTALIDDQPQDAIVSRLSKLLQHLVTTDNEGQWGKYLTGTRLRWESIVLAGQSQGGGMAAFIAKRERVARVIIFSGGWDMDAQGQIAGWYRMPSATPPELWYATYHVEEKQAKTMEEIYRALGLPPENVKPLDLPVHGNTAHGDGIHNPAYKAWWVKALGQGLD